MLRSAFLVWYFASFQSFLPPQDNPPQRFDALATSIRFIITAFSSHESSCVPVCSGADYRRYNLGPGSLRLRVTDRGDAVAQYKGLADMARPLYCVLSALLVLSTEVRSNRMIGRNIGEGIGGGCATDIRAINPKIGESIPGIWCYRKSLARSLADGHGTSRGNGTTGPR